MGSLAILSKSTHALVHIDGLINLQLIITALANKQQQDGVRGKQKKKEKKGKQRIRSPRRRMNWRERINNSWN